MRLIDADAYEHAVQGNPYVSDSVKRYVMCSIQSQPTIDAVPVIRCKDCFWYRSVELKADGTHDKRFKPSRCALWDEDMNDTDFCSYAMPKEADE